MKNTIILIFLSTLLFSCKKDNESKITDDDFIEIKLNDITFHADSSGWSNSYTSPSGPENLSLFGITFKLDSSNSIIIGLGILHKYLDNNFKTTCPLGIKLKDNIFYEIFNSGNYKYRNCCYWTDLTLYEPIVFIEVIKDGVYYSNIRINGNNCSSYINNRFTIQHVDIKKRIQDWSDCNKLERIIKIKGNFECYVYKTDLKTNTIDSIKVYCNDFVGTINN